MKKEMNIKGWYMVMALAVIGLAFFKIAVHLDCWELPLLFFLTGVVTAGWGRRFSLYLFMFLLPFIPATPGLLGTSYPYNYLAIPLFLLSGIVLTVVVKGMRRRETGEEQPGTRVGPVPVDFYYYYLFLGILLISALFLLARWSNVTLPSLAATAADTPVSPGNPYSPDIQRVSFATIFPVVSLFIYFVSPFIFFYVREYRLEEGKVFKWLSLGFYLSVGLAVVQKLSGHSVISDRLGKELKQFYGGFSDFNAFGFFSGVVFLWATYQIQKKNRWGIVTLGVALLGNILSGSRTTLFFILAGMVNLLIGGLRGRRQRQRWVVIGLLAVVVLGVVFWGGTLTRRLGEGFTPGKSFFEQLNSVTNGRVWMTSFALETMVYSPVVGVGTGNFIFYLSYMNYLPFLQEGAVYTYDLPLNHYLLIITEGGVLAGLVFILFMWMLFRGSGQRLLIGTILFSLLFNNFFWFPEAILLFWVLAGLGYGRGCDGLTGGVDSGVGGVRVKGWRSWSGKRGVVAIGVMVVVIGGNMLWFKGLHPQKWAQEIGIRYDYGFWYEERDAGDREFQWTRERAGVYLKLDEGGESGVIRVFCGAPLDHLKGKKQVMDVYWCGRRVKRVIFKENREEVLQVKGRGNGEGFLEVVVRPVFNPGRMGIGSETRDLGVQFYFGGGKSGVKE